MLKIDGSFGEGGGQILRTSLALSMITGKSFEIFNIRANRKKPGLLAQHLKCVEASRVICSAKTHGEDLHSTRLIFEPGEIKAAEFYVNIGTAGSTSLVLQTVFVPLALSNTASKISITGGTHVLWSPAFHYLKFQWLSFLKKIGFAGKLKMVRAGFYPNGDGKIQAEIFPIKTLNSVDLLNRGNLKEINGISAVANLDISVAERQKNQVLKRMQNFSLQPEIIIENMPSRFKNTMMLLHAKFENGSGCFSDLGAIGKRAEKVADTVADELIGFLNSNGCIDKYLADQLILPLSFANGKSEFTTSEITNHLLTNISIVQKFINVDIQVDGNLGEDGKITIWGKSF